MVVERNCIVQDNQKEKKPPRHSTRYVLAIDLGSGGHKAAIVSDTGEVIAGAAENIARGNLAVVGRYRRIVSMGNGIQDGCDGVCRKGLFPGQEFVKNDTQGVEITLSCCFFTFCLLWRHILWRPKNSSRRSKTSRTEALTPI